jgi:hypothetical protein
VVAGDRADLAVGDPERAQVAGGAVQGIDRVVDAGQAVAVAVAVGAVGQVGGDRAE